MREYFGEHTCRLFILFTVCTLNMDCRNLTTASPFTRLAAHRLSLTMWSSAAAGPHSRTVRTGTRTSGLISPRPKPAICKAPFTLCDESFTDTLTFYKDPPMSYMGLPIQALSWKRDNSSSLRTQTASSPLTRWRTLVPLKKTGQSGQRRESTYPHCGLTKSTVYS